MLLGNCSCIALISYIRVANAKSALPPSMAVVLRKEPGRQCSARTALLAISALLINVPAFADNACTVAQYDETSQVKYIHDGDTLHLKDGRKVRLIGINTPEVARGKQAAELFSAEAKNTLKALFKDDKSINLVFGKEEKDHYQRTLAHGFTKDGLNIQAALLKQGYAQVITFPPNTKFTACYLEQERIARCSKKGLWKKTRPISAKKLDDTHIGFKFIKGKLKNIYINRKGIWLNLDDKLTVGIRPDNQPLFDIDTIHRMLNQTVVVRGWLNKNNSNKNNSKSKKHTPATRPYYLRIRHPSAIQVSSSFACS
ncbi:MAG: hypothetical protein GQ549_03535 [Gammaproteobacteria bacterium]|nr:hypothetical protein [Gammaproteobacteria bacterium]